MAMPQQISWTPGTIIQHAMAGERVYRVEEVHPINSPDHLIVGVSRIGTWRGRVWKPDYWITDNRCHPSPRTRFFKVDLKFNHNDWYRPASRPLMKAIYSTSSY